MTDVQIGDRVRSLRAGDEDMRGTVTAGVRDQPHLWWVDWQVTRPSVELRSELAADAAAAPDDETTLAFPVCDEDRVTGPEMPGVQGDGPTFFLSGDDAAAAPAVGVTVDEAEQLVDALLAMYRRTGYGFTKRSVFTAFEKQRANVIALLTAQPEPGTHARRGATGDGGVRG